MTTQFVEGESSTSSQIQWRYDVFLSFRGEDTRKTFTGHLYSRLCQVGVNTFIDDEELRKGEIISTKLEKSIEGSRISIVSFSENYASSSWCLDELVKILECKEKLKQIVLPVFYHVDPSQMRKQTGSFGEALARHEERFGSQRVEKWMTALSKAANLSGWNLQNIADRCESRFINFIVQDVIKEVNHTSLEVASHPVGVDSRAKDIIESSLYNGHQDEVRMVGIYGLGGIGKTTLAKDIYNRLFRDTNFESSCFLSNVRSEAEKFGLHMLQQKLINDLLKTTDYKVNSVSQGVNLIRTRLGSMKALIVLDDADSEEQLESLARERSWFGSGSLIIITTRDSRVLRRLREEERYQAKLLNDDESQQLFNWHAFGSVSPPEEYVGLAKAIIKYSSGLPLALVILGSHLRGEPIQNWKRDWNKLTGSSPHPDIQKILKFSFDGLGGDTQSVFLDIACVFLDFRKDEVTEILNACDFDTECEIATLMQRQLLQMDKGMLAMHDLVRDMGREIVRSESPRYYGGRSRLFIPQEVYGVLRGKNGTEEVEVLRLDKAGELEGVELSTDAIEPMKKLRVLIINELSIHGDFRQFPKELRWLSWHNCPLKCIPSDFPAAYLVFLDMRYSKIEELGLNLQRCPNLKKMNLSYCEYLRRTPNFNGAHSLETLELEFCLRLKKIDESICELKSLQVLNIDSCTSIRKLPIGLGDMQSLRSLHASSTGIEELPKFVEKLTDLETLEVGSKYLRVINQSRVIKSLSTSLSRLVLKNYGLSQGAFRVDIGSLSSLISLDLSGNNFLSLPFGGFSQLPLLKYLLLNDCENLQTLPSLSNLVNLEILELRNCKNLSNIAGLNKLSCIQKIDILGCTSLQNPLNEGFFRACALSSLSYIKSPYEEVSKFYLPFNEIPNWCSNQLTGPSVCLTMPKPKKEYKFLGMVLWLFCHFWSMLSFRRVIVSLSNGESTISMSRSLYTHKPGDYREEVSCVYYMSCLHSPFHRQIIKGGEQILVRSGYPFCADVKKIGIHLLYSDQHGNVISLPV